MVKKYTNEQIIEAMARAVVESESGEMGSHLFNIHWEEFGEGYTNSMRVALKVVREMDEGIKARKKKT